MLQYFSWGNYWTLILALASIYYTVILLFYYLQEVTRFFRRVFISQRVSSSNKGEIVDGTILSNNESSDTQTQELDADRFSFGSSETGLADKVFSPFTSFGDEDARTDHSRLFAFVHELMDEIGNVFKAASLKHYIKEELLTALQLKISAYPMLEDTAYKSAINGFVVTESRKACAVFLSDDELERLWKKGK